LSARGTGNLNLLGFRLLWGKYCLSLIHFLLLIT
jgi:hypothetical protein